MGGIRKPKKKYVAPGHPWQKTRLAEELSYVGEYGLRNKRELWRHRTLLARLRSSARDLVALPIEQRGVQEAQILGRLSRLALLESNSTLDDVLNLTIRDLLERRLQTQVHRQGLAKTLHHARQLIVHGHIVLDGHRVTSPGMLLYRDQERKLEYAPDSPYRTPNHPELPKGDVIAKAPVPAEEMPKPEKIPVKIPKVREIKEVAIEDEELDKELLEEETEETEDVQEGAKPKPGAKGAKPKTPSKVKEEKAPKS